MNLNIKSNTPTGIWWFVYALILWFLFDISIQDIDYWWHIALGREMFNHGSLFHIDPFKIYSAAEPIRSETVLQGQWLGQIALFLGQNWLGDAGVKVIRWGVVFGSSYIFYLRLNLLFQKPNELRLSLVFGLSFLVYMLFGYSGERPQLFSIILMSLGVWLLETIDQHNNSSKYLLGLLFVLLIIWANTHGAFLLFIAILGFTRCLQIIFSASVSKKKSIRNGLFLVALAVFATLISANGLQTYLYLFDLEGSELQQRTSEYVSIFQLFQMSSIVTALVFSLYALLSLVVSGILFREKNFEKGLLVLVLTLIGFSVYRYFVFTAIVTLPIVLSTVIRLVSGFNSTRVIGWLIPVMAIVSLNLLSVFDRLNSKPYFPDNDWLTLNEQSVQGAVFNTVNIGGFLLWHGYPTIRPFIDGRILDTNILVPYTNALWMTDYGKQWFEQQQFSAVFMASKNLFTHEAYPLVAYLKQNKGWTLVYEQGSWIGFVKH